MWHAHEAYGFSRGVIALPIIYSRKLALFEAWQKRRTRLKCIYTFQENIVAKKQEELELKIRDLNRKREVLVRACAPVDAPACLYRFSFMNFS